MLGISNISKSFGLRTLFRNVSFNVGVRDRIAVIGPNGSGKTTLFEIITGASSPDEGEIALKKGVTVGYLKQDIKPFSRRTLLEEVASSPTHINRLEHQIRMLQDEIAENSDAENLDRLLEELGELQQKYELAGGYTSESDARIILSGLGFAESDFYRPVSEFSGGWLMRAELAKLLVLNPDMLLLDEPTNHLDLETTAWFERYLRLYHGAVLLTSHDRTFLNSVASRVLSIDMGTISMYRGTYDQFVAAQEQDRKTREATARRQELAMNRELRFIERFRYKATKARQVQSRIKMLEKVERVEVPRLTRKINFSFPAPERSGLNVIELRDVSKSYGELSVYRNLDLSLNRGDRVALVGPNGAGKSTLLKMLAGVLPFENGSRILGHRVTSAYFAQYYIELLNPENTLLEELRQTAPDETDQQLRGMLGAFLFSGDDVYKRIEVLSGGEKSRLAIAKMLTKPANLLLLDEPTNHLDIPSREILTDALDAYTGTLCFITHDRTLIKQVANKIIEIENGTVRVFQGDYQSFLNQKEMSIVRQTVPDAPADDDTDRKNVRNRSRQRKYLEGQLRNRFYRDVAPVREKITLAERRISELTERIAALEQLLSDPEHYRDGANVADTTKEYRDSKNAMESVTEEWCLLTEQADAMKRDLDEALEQIDL